jgi:hypothetical protein
MRLEENRKGMGILENRTERGLGNGVRQEQDLTTVREVDLTKRLKGGLGNGGEGGGGVDQRSEPGEGMR